MLADGSAAPPEARASAESPPALAPYRPRPARPGRPLKPLPLTRYAAAARVVNLAVAAALLVLASPLVLLAAVLVKATSRGPVFYTQTRLGLLGRPFTIYKVRTMVHDCERHSGARWSTPGDTRVLRMGRLLRRLHLDELPQLWNVVRGDMNLIGPRPERPEFVPQLERAVPRYRDRMLVRPGVTGLAQVQLPPDTDIADVRAKLAYDLYYVRHRGPLLDLRITVATLFKVLGLPCHASRRLLFLPRRDAVEQAYHLHAAEPVALPA